MNIRYLFYGPRDELSVKGFVDKTLADLGFKKVPCPEVQWRVEEVNVYESTEHGSVLFRHGPGDDPKFLCINSKGEKSGKKVLAYLLFLNVPDTFAAQINARIPSMTPEEINKGLEAKVISFSDLRN